MDLAKAKFGRGPRELCGAVDLINHFKLLPHHKIFCKKSVPVLLSDTHYLHNVVGDKRIRKGEGMELDELLCNSSSNGDRREHLRPFDLDTLRDAFQITEISTFDFPCMDREAHTIRSNFKNRRKEERKKHRRHKDRVEDKKKDLKKQKHHHKETSMSKENGEIRLRSHQLHRA